MRWVQFRAPGATSLQRLATPDPYRVPNDQTHTQLSHVASGLARVDEAFDVDHDDGVGRAVQTEPTQACGRHQGAIGDDLPDDEEPLFDSLEEALDFFDFDAATKQRIRRDMEVSALLDAGNQTLH